MVRFLIISIVLVCHSLTAVTQVCTGSLGDPVINITFGAGANPGPALPAGTSSYAYTAKDCPGDGEYAIRNLTFLCNSDSWYTVPFDHTPQDGNNGYYLEINGGDGKDYYVNMLAGLCPNTTYELSFWVMNLSKPGVACDGNATDPDIRYTIEATSGAALATAKTGAVSKRSEATWNQYSLLFKTDASTSVVLHLSNNANGGCGMDFLLDDITVRPCGPSIVAAVAQTGSFSAKACEGDGNAFILNAAIGSGFQAPAFQWQVSTNSGSTWTDIPGANSTTFIRTPTPQGSYLYRILVGEAGTAGITQCRLGSNQVNIFIEKAPYAQGTNYSYCVGGDVTLFAAGGEKYYWTGPNGFTSNQQSPVIPNIKFTDSGLYKVQVTTTAGCRSSDSTQLFIYGKPTAVVSGEASICEGSSTPLLAGGGTLYYWTPSIGLSSNKIQNPFASPVDTTVYTVLVTKNGCSDTATVRVNVWKKPMADAGRDRKVRKGQSVSLSGSVRGTDVSYFWTPLLNINNNKVLSPVITASEDVVYTLHVVSNAGCGASNDDVQVRVYDKINIPNAFSPNGDGINDVWNIEPLELFGDTETQVFDRYGQLVFSSHNYTKPWDGTLHGKPLPMGTYFYIINLKNGNPVFRGSVFIVR